MFRNSQWFSAITTIGNHSYVLGRQYSVLKFLMFRVGEAVRIKSIVHSSILVPLCLSIISGEFL